MHRTSQCNYDDDVILCCSTPTYALEPANIQHSAAASLHKMNQPLSLTHRIRLLCLLTTTNNNKVGSNCWGAAAGAGAVHRSLSRSLANYLCT